MQFNKAPAGLSSEFSKIQFEDWLKTKMNQKQVQGRYLDLQSETVYQIPIVVHVIHNGESIGVASNIPDEQIFNQIDSLNNDFRRLNVDQSNTPSGFLTDAADVKIEFVLAKRDPEGLPTNGIIRVQGNQSNFTINEAVALAANSYWPAEEYFNIWVANLSNGLLGFAKFPISNEPGMDEDPNLNRKIDGVYLDFEYFGTGHNADEFSKGRTLTHEIGHWMGLRHIWGDGGCSVDDFCNDTPTQGSSSSGCPSISQSSCGSVDMFQNYMDYTDDECMNLFTNCQGDRMRTVLENSPRRKELLSSQGAATVVQVANDLGIKSIQSPAFGNCSVTIVPEIEVRNYGSNTINSFSLDLLVDEEVIQTQLFEEPLTSLQTLFVSFSSVNVSSEAQQVSFKVNQVNGGGDGNSDNDCQWINTFFPSTQTVPFVDEFTGTSSSASVLWKLKNSKNNPSAWSYGMAPNITANNEAAILSYYGAPAGSFGELDYLISPVLDLSGLATADLKFKYAYSGFPNNYSDALTVVVSTDCGATFPEENILFQKIGASLATTSSTSSLFVPSDPSDWLEVEKNFGEFADYSEVVLAFIGNNGGGNKLYLDDIEIFSSAANEYDVGIVKVDDIPVVTCLEDMTMQVYVKNYGKKTVNNFSVSYAFDIRQLETPITNLTLDPGKTEVVEIESFNIMDGSYQISIESSKPNGVADEDTTNDKVVTFFAINNGIETIPIRERFSKTLESSDWHFIRTDALSDWEISEFREGNTSDYALVFKGHDVLELGVENWFVSPLLDLSETDVASMTFDVSYANRTGRNDQLRVLASTNCGKSYDVEVYNKKGGELAVAQSETTWLPEADTDWRREFINLNEFVGDSDIRLAFVVTNQNGNNLYLDNVELYVSDDENPVEITESLRSFPNPASDHLEVKFNFNIKEEVLIRVVGLDGEIMAEQSFPNTLNQVYRIDNLNVANSGIYVLQVLGNFTNLSSKVMIMH
ncbi:MAG: choice-of-anchor J domain-containing protein [Reichenbachiella sp.]|uniref:T9SS-dependent choice-of-anchor J family protein n=2 Tax=Reichenbachiella sp. TaxID=2184521 RepID=UPI0032667DA6